MNIKTIAGMLLVTASMHAVEQQTYWAAYSITTKTNMLVGQGAPEVSQPEKWNVGHVKALLQCACPTIEGFAVKKQSLVEVGTLEDSKPNIETWRHRNSGSIMRRNWKCDLEYEGWFWTTKATNNHHTHKAYVGATTNQVRNEVESSTCGPYKRTLRKGNIGLVLGAAVAIGLAVRAWQKAHAQAAEKAKAKA